MSVNIVDNKEVLKSSLWNFAVSIYQKNGVSAACLFLQESCDLDVPLLFCAGFLVVNGKCFDPAILSALQKQTSPWQRDVVQSLRVVRQKLKSGSYPVQIDKGEALRQSVKAAELSAEKIQLNMMEDATAQVPQSDIQPNLSNLTAVLTMVVDAQSKTALTPEHIKNIQLIANAILDREAERA